MTVEAAYFNKGLAIWEPLIEKNEGENDKFKPWDVNINVK